MNEHEIITLEDKKNYILIKSIYKNGFNYLLLSDTKDNTDIFFRKTTTKDPLTILPIDNEEELEKVIELFK